jgi:PAS domain S-box-containing protein
MGVLFGYTRELWSYNLKKRKEAESNLLESEEKYRRIINAVNEGIIIYDILGKLLFVNKRFSEMMGYYDGELVGRNFIELIPDDQACPVKQSAKTLISANKVQETTVLRRKDGALIWTLFNSIPIYDDKGSLTANLVTHTDITERKKLEDELLLREKFYNNMISNLPRSSIFILDKNFRILRSGGSQLAKMGLTPEMPEGKTLSEIFPSEISSLLNATYIEALKGEESSCETTFDNLHMLNVFVPIRNDSGTVGNILILSMDISSQKKTENDLRMAQKKLNLALENANIGVWEWDLKTDKMIWDSRIEKIFGIEPGTVKPTYAAFESFINEEDLPHFRDAVNKTINLDFPFETIFRTKSSNDESKYISTKALVNKYRKGKSVGLTGVCFDVTSMKKGTEKVLIDLNEELMRSNKDLQQFAYVASHDLQEPLRMVSSFTQMLEQRYHDKLDDDGREYIRYAVDGSKRMYFLLNGLLAYSRVQSKAKEFGKVRMTEVIEKVLRNLSLKIKEKNAVVIYNKLPVVVADENQMIQLIQNLTDNALKFSPVSPKITISAKSLNDYHVFSVKDEGIGIEEQYFEKIFKIFQRLHRKDDYEGTGIGLAICKRIVERHGGNLWVESEPGNGSTFFFTIPR